MAQSLWQLQAWQVASRAFLGCVLGPRASWGEAAGAGDFQRGPSRDSQGRKGKANPTHRHLGSRTSIQSPPGPAGRGAPLQRRAFSRTPCLPSLGPEKSTWSGAGAGSSAGVGRGSGEKEPSLRLCSEASVHRLCAPAAGGRSSAALEDAQGGKGTAVWAAVYEPLRSRDKGHST